jgi:intracellular septation protein A
LSFSLSEPLSRLIWALVLIPIQVKQARIARDLNDTMEIPDEYWRLSTRWKLFGAIAVALPLVNVYWMVFKPS